MCETPRTFPWEEEMALCGRVVTGSSGKAWGQKRAPEHWACLTLQQSQAAKQKLARTATASNPHQETLQELSERLLVAQRRQRSHGILTEGTTGWRGQQSPSGCCTSTPSSLRRDASVCKIFLWLSYFTCRRVLSQKHSHTTTRWWAAIHHPPLGRPTRGNTASGIQTQRNPAFLITAATWSNGKREESCVCGPQVLAWSAWSNLKPQ